MITKTNKTNRYHHGDLRRTLLEEAALIIREDGEGGLTMRKLAIKAGVSHTAPYHHFKDKQELLSAIAEQGFCRFRNILTMEGSELSEKRMQRFVRDYLDFAVDHAEYYDLMFGGHLWKSDSVAPTLQKEAHGVFRAYAELVRSWQQQKLINPQLNTVRYSQVSWSTLHGMSRLLIDGIYLDAKAMKPICDQTAKMFWRELKIS